MVRLSVSKVLTLCITMLTTMLLARFRTIEEYGAYSQMLLVISLGTSLLMLGLPNSINYFLARAESQEERSRFLSVYYTLSTLLSVVIGVVLVLAIPLIEAYFHNPTIRGFAYFLALYPLASIVASSVENVLVVYQRTRLLMAYRLFNSAMLLLTVVVIQWLGLGFTAYMYAFTAVNLLFAAAVYVIVWRLCGGFRFAFDGELIRSIAIFSVPMGLGAVVGTLNVEIDKLLIGYMMDTGQLAIYTNAAKELPLTIIASAITAVLLPRLTRMIKNGRTEEAIRLWNTATELALMVIALAVAGIFTYAKEAIEILYSAKYLPGITVFRIYTLNLLLRCTYFGIVLQAYGKTKKILYCSIASLALNMVLNPLLYHLMGMVGPAVATFLAILMILLLQLYWTSRTVCVPFGRVFPWKNATFILAINAAFAVAFYALKQVLPLEQYGGEIVESLLLGAVWTAIYLFFIWKRLRSTWRELNQEEAGS